MTTIPSNSIIDPFADKYRKLFANIVTTCGTMHGWATHEKCCTLAALTISTKPILAVEVGVWGGRSMLPVAMTMKELGHGKIIGIDPWDAQVSARDEVPDSAEWWAAQNHENIYKYCLAMIRSAGVESQVEIIRKKSDDVEPPNGIGLLHVDGSHMGQALRDSERFLPNVIHGGYVVFDDTRWVGGAVLRSIDHAEELGFSNVFEKVDNDGNDWMVMQRSK